MPRERKVRQVVEPNFEEEFKRLVKTKDGEQMVLDAMFVICQILDQCCTEDSTWFNVGLQQGGASIQVTLHEGRDKSFANGRNLVEFLSGIRSL